jgi:hypothetical protein
MNRDNKTTAIIVGSFIVLAIGGIILYHSLKKGLRYPKDAKWANNSDTLKKVSELHPKVRQRVADLFTDIEKELGLEVIATSGLRTTAQQAALDLTNNQNADAGLSDHEYGFAIDINVKKDGNTILRKASSNKAWIDSGVVGIAKKKGLKWGGDFNSYHDPIHFYDDFGLPATEMPKMKLAGKVDKEGYLKV